MNTPWLLQQYHLSWLTLQIPNMQLPIDSVLSVYQRRGPFPSWAFARRWVPNTKIARLGDSTWSSEDRCSSTSTVQLGMTKVDRFRLCLVSVTSETRLYDKQCSECSTVADRWKGLRETMVDSDEPSWRKRVCRNSLLLKARQSYQNWESLGSTKSTQDTELFEKHRKHSKIGMEMIATSCRIEWLWLRTDSTRWFQVIGPLCLCPILRSSHFRAAPLGVVF